ncbi:hypothetical protein TIFTF001_017141 [Ficus carica]|uniref:Uncharacterized protein n=1 Tax=Ficus carica TaxID=3494 RepID=A0AA88AQ97_FICCA|nr:hypothetical protein TIFTF001_017141 [Ficus carica]
MTTRSCTTIDRFASTSMGVNHPTMKKTRAVSCVWRRIWGEGGSSIGSVRGRGRGGEGREGRERETVSQSPASDPGGEGGIDDRRQRRTCGIKGGRGGESPPRGPPHWV